MHTVCRSGSAIVVETQDALSVFDRHYRNPLCFLQYYNASVPLAELYHNNVCIILFIWFIIA